MHYPNNPAIHNHNLLKKKITLLIFSLFYCFSCFGQANEIKAIQRAMPHIKDSLLYVDTLNRISALIQLKHIDSTFYYARKAREIAERHGYAKGKAKSLNNIGLFFMVKGNQQLALRYFNEARTGYLELNDALNANMVSMNISVVYKYMGKDQKSYEGLRDVLYKAQNLKPDSLVSIMALNYVSFHWKKLPKDTIDRYLKKGYDIAVKYKNRAQIVALTSLIAQMHIQNGEVEKGIEMNKQAVADAIKEELYYYASAMCSDLADQFLKTDSSQAVFYYKQGLKIAEEKGFPPFSQHIARNLINFYRAHKDNSEELRYSRVLHQLLAEQNTLDNQSGIDYIDYAIKDQEINGLHTRLKYQVGLLILAGVICILMIWIIVSVRRNLKRSKDLNGLISKQNLQLHGALAALEQSQADNTRMLQIVAHDLRNPIGGIYAISSMMLDAENRSESDLEMLEMIRLSGKNSLDLVNDLLHVHSKSEELKKDPVDLSELLRYCIQLLNHKAEDKGQHIALKTLKIIMPVSREKLWRVVNNLIANAIKFSPKGAQIEIWMEEQEKSVRIMVKDYGIGIPEDIKDQIFNMFTAAKRTGTSGEQPFGLGLAISRQIVEAHKGKLWFESEEGIGTTFFVELPK